MKLGIVIVIVIVILFIGVAFSRIAGERALVEHGGKKAEATKMLPVAGRLL